MVHLGPLSYLEINGQDVTDHAGGFTGIDPAAATPHACDWNTVVDAYNRLAPDPPAEPAEHPRVIDQDGNPVRPPTGWLRDITCG